MGLPIAPWHPMAFHGFLGYELELFCGVGADASERQGLLRRDAAEEITTSRAACERAPRHVMVAMGWPWLTMK